MKYRRLFRLLICLSLCLLVWQSHRLVSAAQQEKAAPPKRDEAAMTPARGGVESAPSAASILVAPDEDYRIGSNDVLEIQIEDAPELSNTFRVTAAGTFLMPYLGRLTARGKTTEELAKMIADGLRERYIFDPRVSITIKQYNSRSFFIHGSVRSPGVYQIEGRPSLLELLTVSGGLMPDHSSTAFIIRRHREIGKAADENEENKDKQDERQEETAPGASAAPEAQYTLLKVNVNALLKGRFEQNMFLEPGDIVNVPPTEVFFVAGEVQAPGSFPLKEGTTLRQAISLAQGMNFKAAPGRGLIFREHPETGKRQELAVDIGAVMGGKQEDQPIFANDVIIVPNSRMKTIAAPVLSAFGVSAARLPIRY